MKTTFRKAMAVLLAALLLSATAMSAFAINDTEQTYHIICREDSEHIHIIPIDQQDNETDTYYVHADDIFEFWVKVDEGYSDKHVIVEINGAMTEPDVHNVYRISDIRADQTVTAYFEMTKPASNMMSSLMILLHNIAEWFKNLLGFFGVSFG